MPFVRVFYQRETIWVDAAHIVSADITIYDGSNTSLEESILFVSKLLSINAASLKLCLHEKKVLARVKRSFNDIPDFQILRHLDLDYATGDFLFDLLLKSPRLETLVLKVRGDWRLDFAVMPGCLFTLKVVKFVRFAGTPHELNFAKYVMKNALALEKITFCSSKLFGSNNCEKLREKIFSYRTWFSSAVIEFSYIT
ncbi:FBD-associated F-box protein At5g38590-like isoform X2 [Cicer arietinum]|uniref:FBD-associated F-box protein At5g38590-like isoform X2 n=1 Tax=Cicer arietinum TaxID=3827 RepID=UPI003CC60CB4